MSEYPKITAKASPTLGNTKRERTQRNKNKITRKQKDEPKLSQKRIRKDAVDKQNLRGGRVVLFGIFFCHHFNYFVPIPGFFNFSHGKKK